MVLMQNIFAKKIEKKLATLTRKEQPFLPEKIPLPTYFGCQEKRQTFAEN
jgi:hypothetical protein